MALVYLLCVKKETSKTNSILNTSDTKIVLDRKITPSHNNKLSEQDNETTRLLKQYFPLLIDKTIASSEKLVLCDKILDVETFQDKIKSTVAQALSQCRGIRNSYGVTEAKLEKQRMVRSLIEQDGWHKVIEKIKQGELSAHSGLQSLPHPMHNLLDTFVTSGVQETEAYEQLLSLGTKPNAMFLSAILIKGRRDLLELYEKHTNIFELDDMKRNIVYNAAAFGTLNDMALYLDKGVPYQDVLNRDPLVILIERRGGQISPEQLIEFVDKYNIELSQQHEQAANQRGRSHLLDAIRERVQQ